MDFESRSNDKVTYLLQCGMEDVRLSDDPDFNYHPMSEKWNMIQFLLQAGGM